MTELIVQILEKHNIVVDVAGGLFMHQAVNAKSLNKAIVEICDNQILKTCKDSMKIIKENVDMEFNNIAK